MFKRNVLITALIAAAIVGGMTYDEYQAQASRAADRLFATIAAPFCLPPKSGPQVKTFFRLAMAQDAAAKPRRTEVGPFSNAIPDAESVARADADPQLTFDLGRLHYPITTRVPEAQKFFDQGLRLAYAFNHREALRAFRKARSLDPACAMCWWGEALVLGPNINAGMDAESAAPAFDAIAKARTLTVTGPKKERALIDALGARYAMPVPAERGALDAAYAKSMAAVAAQFPDDDEIALQYAESLMDLQPWDYWEGGGAQPKGRTAEIMALLEKVLQRQPDHPGAIHYYIHLTEASSDPKRAVVHAQRLGALMPGAGHIVHMPFHTFFRVGMYKEAMAANRAAVQADEAYIQRAAPVGIYPQAYYPHNVHSLLVSAQMAGDGATVIDAAQKLDRVVADAAARDIAWVQPIKAAPYFAHAQFSDSRTILALSDPGDQFPYVRAMWHYARGIALANGNDVASAQREADAIARLEQSGGIEALRANGVPANDVLKLARQVMQGRIAQSRGDLPGAIAAFGAAVALEDTLAYSEPPYWYYPTRQSLGALMTLAGDLDGAERVLRESLARTPNNGWALYALSEVYKRRSDADNAQAARELLDRAWAGDSASLNLERM